MDYFTIGYISADAREDNDDFFRRTADRMNVAAAAEVKFQFTGQDETLGDPIESLRRSYAYFNR